MEQGAELFGTTYRRGDIVFRQGEPGTTMYIIQTGAVEVSQQQNGQETVIAILEKGDFFGEMALFQDQARSATITALGRTRLIPLNKEILMDRLKRDPDVSLHLLKKLIQRIQLAHRRYRSAYRENDAFRNAIAAHTKNVLIKGEVWPAGEGADRMPDVRHIAEKLLGAQANVNPERSRQVADSGETIFREGEPGDSMYLVVSGSVGVSKGATHTARLIDTIGPGEFFGEMALIASIPRSATVTALEPTELIAIDKNRLLKSIQNEPQLAIDIIKTLILRLSYLENVLSNPGRIRVRHASPWMPRLKNQDRISLSIVSLSTCAGCSAVVLDRDTLTEILSMASIDYCQMLMDREDLPESDVIVIDGVVRLKEDERRLSEARRRCRHLVAWGTCAAFAGIPGLANRYEVETVIEESYGTTNDAFSYYFSGTTGIDRSNTYQLNGIELHRRAFAIDSFVRVDTYLPGCPPRPSILLNWLYGFTGGQPPKTAPIVCYHCGRKPLKSNAEKASLTHGAASDNYCFNSMGRLCLGFMIRGGCDAVCPTSGVPCWGCRGPSKKTIKGLQAGETLEEIARRGFEKRHVKNDDRLRNTIKKFRQAGHFMFDIDANAAEKLLRIK